MYVPYLASWASPGHERVCLGSEQVLGLVVSTNDELDGVELDIEGAQSDPGTQRPGRIVAVEDVEFGGGFGHCCFEE